MTLKANIFSLGYVQKMKRRKCPKHPTVTDSKTIKAEILSFTYLLFTRVYETAFVCGQFPHLDSTSKESSTLICIRMVTKYIEKKKNNPVSFAYPARVAMRALTQSKSSMAFSSSSGSLILSSGSCKLSIIFWPCKAQDDEKRTH